MRHNIGGAQSHPGADLLPPAMASSSEDLVLMLRDVLMPLHGAVARAEFTPSPEFIKTLGKPDKAVSVRVYRYDTGRNHATIFETEEGGLVSFSAQGSPGWLVSEPQDAINFIADPATLQKTSRRLKENTVPLMSFEEYTVSVYHRSDTTVSIARQLGFPQPATGMGGKNPPGNVRVTAYAVSRKGSLHDASAQVESLKTGAPIIEEDPAPQKFNDLRLPLAQEKFAQLMGLK
jgi:hypothetical protein